MEKEFIKIQLFGDPSGDPNKNDPTPSGGGDPGKDGNAPSNDADILLQWKKEHVTREEYEKEKARADAYLKAILENKEGDVLKAEGMDEEKVDPEELAKELFVEDNTMTDLEYVTKMLELRKARIAAGDRDPFLPDNPDNEDIEIAQNVADVFEDCVKLANGDNASFLGILQGRMKEAKMIPGSLNKNNRR